MFRWLGENIRPTVGYKVGLTRPPVSLPFELAEVASQWMATDSYVLSVREYFGELLYGGCFCVKIFYNHHLPGHCLCKKYTQFRNEHSQYEITRISSSLQSNTNGATKFNMAVQSVK